MRVVLALTLLSGLIAGLGFAVWSTADPTSVLETQTAPELQQVAPTAVTVSGLINITASLTDVRLLTLTASTEGVVTDVLQAGEVIAGNTLASVSDLALVAFVADAPMYQDVHQGDRGPNARRAMEHLRLTGFYHAPSSDVTGAAFASAVKRYNKSVGRSQDGDVLTAAGLVWVGDSSPARFTPSIVVGDPVSPGTAVGTGRVLQASATVSEGTGTSSLVLGRNLVGSVSEVPIMYTQGSLSLNQETILALAESGRTEFAIQLSLPEPIIALGIPAGALVVDDEKACVYDAEDEVAGPTAVLAIAEQPGLVLLKPGPLPKLIVANPWQFDDMTTCIE